MSMLKKISEGIVLAVLIVGIFYGLLILSVAFNPLYN